ncbi:LppU/SCO3897 family protein [Williamsia phyllosphaerae]|uniref:IgA FC receptor n=1 Tax=Williamsia phyllosphaerae TaxID=885042 RepID=A0ABQ1V5E1_9NOCA|nr:hypothetical protein [Williamsia phyllosphaerae]GGF36438.1 hypothetical protein GCM10007298_35310 [Williamsia phyllosphaerae]
MVGPENRPDQNGPQYPPPGYGPPPPGYGPPPPGYGPPPGGHAPPPGYGPPPPGFGPPPAGYPAPGLGGFGPNPYPAFGGPPPPPPRKSSKRIVWIIVGVVIAIALILAGARAVLADDVVSTDKDVSVGDCITVSGENAALTPKQASCSDSSFTFKVVQKFSVTSLPCAGENFAQITSPDFGKLCLAPNFRVGKCYSFPAQDDAALSGVKESDCSAPSGSTEVIVKVLDQQSTTSPNFCPTGRVLAFPVPEPVSYCLAPASS